MNLHTVTAIAESEENHCRLCGKKLGLFKRLSHAEFCGDSHQAAYMRSLNEMAVARLHAAASRTVQENKPAAEVQPAVRPVKHDTAAA
jgi:hypothetical protein